MNFQQYQRFRDSIGAAALSHRPGITEAARDILLFPLADFFCYPSVVWIVCLASLWACEWLIGAVRGGAVSAVRAMTQLECYCACWLIGSGVVLAVSPDKVDRRCIGLVLPLMLLAAAFVRRQFLPESNVVGPTMTARGTGPLRDSRLWIALGAPAALYWSACLHAMGCLVAKDLGFPVTGGHRILTWSLALPFGIALAVLAFPMRKTRFVTGLMLALFLGTTMALDSIWYVCAGHSLRDASREMGHFGKAKGFILGPFSHELSLENRLFPIFSPWTEHIRYNGWFAEEAQRADYLAIAELTPQGKILDSMLSPGFPALKSATDVKPLEEIDFCPELIQAGYRFRGELYRCAPVKIPAKPL